MPVIKIFKKLCEIDHCSHQAKKMQKYLVDFAANLDYKVSVDDVGNILCHKEGAKITLQSHYDMVCIGQAPKIEIEENDGWLRAKDSTLGADNGIGIAMSLALMQEGIVVDALFTAEEEVGLLGARALALPLQTPYLLNIDSEEEGIVTIGCAGGVDILVRFPITRETQEVSVQKIVAQGFVGGHSGVDIDRDIPNAIKVLVEMLDEDASFSDIKGGERRNSIAKYAEAQVSQTAPLSSEKHLCSVIKESRVITAMLRGFRHGVRSMDSELGIVKTSINLAMIESHENYVEIHLSGRSMEYRALNTLEEETLMYFKNYGCEVKSEGFYPPWQPDKSPFAKKVLEISKQYFSEASFGAIHAGLECGILKEKAPTVDMASIGPNIMYPHSNRECVELASVKRVYALVKAIVEKSATS